MLPAIVSKTIIILFLIAIFASLTSGLYYLIRDRGQSNRAVKALSWRIGLSLTLFILLMIGFATGLMQPHGLGGGA
ncbi:MAG: twin transmembrane helix small protein [Gammaproteobacteria bacterium]|nr:twin transmembrane helix small protein [Gammaproteobacteria bacterium]